MLKRRGSAWALLVLSISATAAQANNIFPNHMLVDASFAGAAISFPLGINDARFAVGYYQVAGPNDVPHAYEWNKGVTTNIDVPFGNAVGTIAASVDNHGTVVGTWMDTSGHDHGFIRTLPNGCVNDQGPGCTPQYSSFDVSLSGAIFSNTVAFEFGPGLGTGPIGLNDSGTITGLYATQDASGTYSNGFVLSNGTYTAIDHSIDHLNGDGTKLFSINNSGAIVGDTVFQPLANGHQLTHGFLLNNGVYTDINAPSADSGGFGTQVNGINNSDTVVGVYSDPFGFGHGLFWTPATAANPDRIDIPNSPFTELHEINSQGDITGAYYEFTGQEHGFILFTPEPSTLLLGGLSLGALLLVRRRSLTWG